MREWISAIDFSPLVNDAWTVLWMAQAALDML